jgi:hypothetical protein
MAQLVAGHDASSIGAAFDQHCRAHGSIDESNEQNILRDFRAVGEHPADRQGLHVIGQDEGNFGGGIVYGLERDGSLIGDGGTHQNLMGFGVNQSGGAEADCQGLIVHHFFQHAGGGHDHVLGSGDLAAYFLANEVSVEVQPANFDGALRDEDADDMPSLWIEFEGNSGAASAGRLGAAFPEQALLEQAGDDVADSVGRLAGSLVKFPAAEASLVPEDLNDFSFAIVQHKGSLAPWR